MIMIGKTRSDWRNHCPVKVILDFITPTILYEVYKWKMRPNNGVDYIFNFTGTHKTWQCLRQAARLSAQKWHTASLRHVLQIMKLLRFHFYARSQLL